jgi:hypothetical protein
MAAAPSCYCFNSFLRNKNGGYKPILIEFNAIACPLTWRCHTHVTLHT